MAALVEVELMRDAQLLNSFVELRHVLGHDIEIVITVRHQHSGVHIGDILHIVAVVPELTEITRRSVDIRSNISDHRLANRPGVPFVCA